MRQKFLLLMVTFLVMVGLSGCTRDLVEVDSINLVLAFGVDEVEDLIRVSAEIVLAQGAQGGTQQTTGPQYMIVEATGKTIEQAMNQLNTQVPRQLFLPHNTVVVFGRQYAEHGVSRAFDYLERDRSYRRNQLILVTSGEARDVLKASTSPESINALGLRQLVEQYAENSPIVMSQQLRIIREYLQASNSPILTAVDLNKNQSPVISGIGLFKGGKLAGFLTEEQSVGLLWLIGPTREIVMNVPCQGQSGVDIGSTFRVLSSKVTISPQVDKGQAVIRVKLRGKAELERACPDLKMNGEAMDEMEKELDKQITSGIASTITILQDKDVDAAQFGTALFQQNPKVWRKYANQWDELFAKASVKYDVQIHLLRSGLSATSPTVDYTREQLPPKSGREAKVK